MATTFDVKAAEAKLIAKCWKDPSFKELLKSNPKEALNQIGVDLPSTEQFTLIEEEQNHWVFCCPMQSSSTQKFSEVELEQFAVAENRGTCGQWNTGC